MWFVLLSTCVVLGCSFWYFIRCKKNIFMNEYRLVIVFNHKVEDDEEFTTANRFSFIQCHLNFKLGNSDTTWFRVLFLLFFATLTLWGIPPTCDAHLFVDTLSSHTCHNGRFRSRPELAVCDIGRLEVKRWDGRHIAKCDIIHCPTPSARPHRGRPTHHQAIKIKQVFSGAPRLVSFRCGRNCQTVFSGCQNELAHRRADPLVCCFI